MTKNKILSIHEIIVELSRLVEISPDIIELEGVSNLTPVEKVWQVDLPNKPYYTLSFKRISPYRGPDSNFYDDLSGFYGHAYISNEILFKMLILLIKVID